MSDMLKLDRVIETCLYVDDLGRAARFYEEALGLKALTYDERFRAYDVGGQSVLLLFRRGGTLKTVHMPGGTIPPHDGHSACCVCRYGRSVAGMGRTAAGSGCRHRGPDRLVTRRT